MDIINKRNTQYKKLIDNFTIYVNKLNATYTYVYDINLEFKKQKRIITNSMKIINNTKYDNVDNMFKVIYNINSIENAFYVIYNIINVDMSNIPTNMSNTFLLNLENDFNKLSSLFVIFRNDNFIFIKNLLHFTLNKIKSIPIVKIDNLFNKYPNTVKIYTHYIQYKLDNTTDPKEIDIILNYLRNVKENLFSNIDLDKSIKSNKHTINLQRFGIIPLWQSLDNKSLLKKLLNIISFEDNNKIIKKGGGYDTNNIKDISALCEEKKIGLFLMVSISENPVEFNFTSLINRREVDKYNIEPNNGLNNDILNKYNIIRTMQSNIKTPIFKNFKLGDIKSNKWVIIRTINGISYDIMGFVKKNILFTEKFINKIDRGSSNIISRYQYICSNKFMNYIKPSKPIVLESKTFDLSRISNKVNSSINKYIENQLKTIPKNLKELYGLINDDDIYNIVGEILIDSYKDIQDIDTKDNNELSSTFLINIDYIINIFLKSMQELLSKSKFNEYMFREKKTKDLIIYIKSEISIMIKKTCDKAFDSSKDLYENIRVKKNLLNTEL